MSLVQQFQLMADYNRWMNESLYKAASTLEPAALAADRGAFFGSLHGTFNHLLVADIIWLQRFAHHPNRFPSLQSVLAIPTPQSLEQTQYEDFQSMREARRQLDATILAFVDETVESDYEQILVYKNTSGITFKRLFGPLVLHFFNHQTHHRGQITVLLSQPGIDYGTTDLLERIAEVS